MKNDFFHSMMTEIYSTKGRKLTQSVFSVVSYESRSYLLYVKNVKTKICVNVKVKMDLVYSLLLEIPPKYTLSSVFFSSQFFLKRFILLFFFCVTTLATHGIVPFS